MILIRTIKTSNKRLLALLSMAAFLVMVGPAVAKTQYCGPKKSSAAVIVIHGGSFILGGPDMTADTCKAFAAKGWRVTNLDYPLGDLNGASQSVKLASRIAKRNHQRVFAYGESAGGGLAALAAARRWVDGAFAWAPVSNLYLWQEESQQGFVNWQPFKDSSTSTLTRNSADYWAGKRSAPILVVHGQDDTLVNFSQSTRLKSHWPKMTLTPAQGGHYQYERSYLDATKNATKCFSRQKPCQKNWPE